MFDKFFRTLSGSASNLFIASVSTSLGLSALTLLDELIKTGSRTQAMAIETDLAECFLSFFEYTEDMERPFNDGVTKANNEVCNQSYYYNSYSSDPGYPIPIISADPWDDPVLFYSMSALIGIYSLPVIYQLYPIIKKHLYHRGAKEITTEQNEKRLPHVDLGGLRYAANQTTEPAALSRLFNAIFGLTNDNIQPENEKERAHLNLMRSFARQLLDPSGEFPKLPVLSPNVDGELALPLRSANHLSYPDREAAYVNLFLRHVFANLGQENLVPAHTSIQQEILNRLHEQKNNREANIASYSRSGAMYYSTLALLSALTFMFSISGYQILASRETELYFRGENRYFWSVASQECQNMLYYTNFINNGSLGVFENGYEQAYNQFTEDGNCDTPIPAPPDSVGAYTDSNVSFNNWLISLLFPNFAQYSSNTLDNLYAGTSVLPILFLVLNPYLTSYLLSAASYTEQAEDLIESRRIPPINKSADTSDKTYNLSAQKQIWYQFCQFLIALERAEKERTSELEHEEAANDVEIVLSDNEESQPLDDEKIGEGGIEIELLDNDNDSQRANVNEPNPREQILRSPLQCPNTGNWFIETALNPTSEDDLQMHLSHCGVLFFAPNPENPNPPAADDDAQVDAGNNNNNAQVNMDNDDNNDGEELCPFRDVAGHIPHNGPMHHQADPATTAMLQKWRELAKVFNTSSLTKGSRFSSPSSQDQERANESQPLLVN